MADQKISELTNITGASLADADEFVVVDVSADQTKAVTRAEFFKDTPAIGIGTSSPSSHLHVNSGVYDTIATFESGDRYGTLKLKDSTSTASTGGVTLGVDGDALYVQTGSINSTAMQIDSSGNVGIGTANPAYNLDLQSSGDTVLNVKSTGTGDADAVVVLDAADTGEAVVMFRVDGTEKASIEWYDAGQDLNIVTAAGTNGSIDFQPNGSLAMRIESDGNVGIGTQNPSHKIHVPSGNIFAGSPVTAFPAVDTSGSGAGLLSAGVIAGVRDNYSLTLNRHTTTGSVAQFYYSGSFKGSISVTGSATAYNTSSDYRLKENITPVQGAADIVKAMQPVTYTFKSDGSWHDGFLAHELQELHPRAVIGEKDAMKDEEYEVTPAVEATYDDEGVELTPAVPAVMGTRSVPDYQGVDYSKLTTILTAALQEALNKIDALETRLTALEG